MNQNDDKFSNGVRACDAVVNTAADESKAAATIGAPREADTADGVEAPAEVGAEAGDETGAARQADRRVVRTRRLLTDALIQLSLENGYESVTIRDITDRAGVGYATFFRHYSAKEALLADVLETFLEELTGLILAQVTDPVTTGRIIFEHARRHRDLYLLLLDSRGSSDLLNRVHEVGRDGIARLARPRPDSPVPFEIAANHIITSFMSLIAWWLENDTPYSAGEMGRICSELIMKPTRNIAFKE